MAAIARNPFNCLPWERIASYNVIAHQLAGDPDSSAATSRRPASRIRTSHSRRPTSVEGLLIMAIHLKCPSCHSSLRLGDKLAGEKVQCPRCHKLVSVPEVEGDYELIECSVEEER